MPYSIRKSGDKYALVLKSTGKVLGKHPNKRSAQRQIAAIEANKKGKK